MDSVYRRDRRTGGRTEPSSSKERDYAYRRAVKTSCAGDRHNCVSPLHVDNIFVFIRQVAIFPACWLFKTSATSWTFWPWKWCPSHVWRQLCANFSVPGPLCSRLGPDVRDRRQTASSLNASTIWGGAITMIVCRCSRAHGLKNCTDNVRCTRNDTAYQLYLLAVGWKDAETYACNSSTLEGYTRTPISKCRCFSL